MLGYYAGNGGGSWRAWMIGPISIRWALCSSVVLFLVAVGGRGEDWPQWRGMERNVYLTLRQRLFNKGVYIHQFAPVSEIRKDGVYVCFNNDLLLFFSICTKFLL